MITKRQTALPAPSAFSNGFQNFVCLDVQVYPLHVQGRPFFFLRADHKYLAIAPAYLYFSLTEGLVQKRSQLAPRLGVRIDFYFCAPGDAARAWQMNSCVSNN
jgi:hypothetical protein